MITVIVVSNNEDNNDDDNEKQKKVAEIAKINTTRVTRQNKKRNT